MNKDGNFSFYESPQRKRSLFSGHQPSCLPFMVATLSPKLVCGIIELLQTAAKGDQKRLQSRLFDENWWPT
jgi:hypothetical protein